ncbi:MAG: NUDIX hydrolase [Lachnospiraceae bacterium]|nr:NUDIX hydrolase [Lachnospiraceae bacterium]
MQIVEQIRNYIPYNEQEEHDREELLYLLETGGGRDLFTRENKTAHMTASAWVVNPDRSKVLMVYHNIYHSWSWLGGHADGECDLLNVAIREVQEESGIQNVTPVSDDIFSLEILTVDGHEKRGEYVSSHLHLNVTYLLQADDTESLCMKPDENSGVSWFTPQGAVDASTEPWFKQRIYRKLNEKLAAVDQKTNKK